MRLSIALMGHPKRQHFVDELLPKLPGAELVMDEKDDRWDTGRRSLLAHHPKATHHLVIQDDAIPCRNLLPGLRRAIEHSGEHPLCLYIGKVRPKQRIVSPAVKHILREGGCWMAAEGPWWGVGVVVPVADIPEIVAFGDRAKQYQNYDKKIEKFYSRRKIACWYSVPSLVDHRPVDENPSLVAGRHGNRRAQLFIGDRPATEIDWTRPAIPLKSRFHHPMSGRTLKVYVGGRKWAQMKKTPAWEQIDDNSPDQPPVHAHLPLAQRGNRRTRERDTRRGASGIRL